MISVPSRLCEGSSVPLSHPLCFPSLPQEELKPLEEAAGDQALPPARSCSTSPPPLAAPSALEAEERPPAPEENGEAEPMRNGAGHTSETESSDSGATPGDNEGSTGAPPDLFQEGRGCLLFISVSRLVLTINSHTTFAQYEMSRAVFLTSLLLFPQIWRLMGSVSTNETSCWAFSSWLPVHRSQTGCLRSVTLCWTRCVKTGLSRAST